MMSICPHKDLFEKWSLKTRKCQRVFVSDVCCCQAAKGLRHAKKNPAELFEKKASITNSIFFWCLDAEKKQMSGCPLPREVTAKTLRLVCVCVFVGPLIKANEVTAMRARLVPGYSAGLFSRS